MRSGGSAGAWRHLEDEVRPDVALLQEALPRERAYPGFTALGGGRRWGSLVVVRDDLTAVPLDTLKGSAMKTPVAGFALSQTYPGSVHACEIELKDAEPLVAVSVYVVQENNVAQTVVHRILSDLFPLLTDARYKDRIILGGDLNVSTQLGGMWARHSRSALDRITTAYGLVNLTAQVRPPTERLEGCPCRDKTRSAATYEPAALQTVRCRGRPTTCSPAPSSPRASSAWVVPPRTIRRMTFSPNPRRLLHHFYRHDPQTRRGPPGRSSPTLATSRASSPRCCPVISSQTPRSNR